MYSKKVPLERSFHELMNALTGRAALRREAMNDVTLFH